MANRSFTRSQRMTKRWISLPDFEVVFTANGTRLFGILSLTEPSTVMRIMGEYSVQCQGAGVFVTLDKALVTIGIGVVSTDAAELGFTAMPDPADELQYPWLYWREHTITVFDAAALDGSQDQAFHRVSFDVKSMRKLKPRESLVMIGQYRDVVGTPPVEVFSAAARVLLAVG